MKRREFFRSLLAAAAVTAVAPQLLVGRENNDTFTISDLKRVAAKMKRDGIRPVPKYGYFMVAPPHMIKELQDDCMYIEGWTIIEAEETGGWKI